MEYLSTIKEWLAGAYRESPKLTTFAIYAIFIFAAILAHQYVKGISRPGEGQKPLPTIKQKATDSTCSNITAGGDVNVDCPQAKDSDDKREPSSQH